MNKKNIWILILLIIGISGIVAVEGYAKPKVREQEARYAAEQQNPYTHDISRTLQFKSKYMGDAGNLMNLNNSLPFNELNRTYQLYPDELTAELKFPTSSVYVDAAKLKEMLVYNTTANFAMIDNLQVLRLTFEDITFTIHRKAVEEWYGGEDSLRPLQNEKQWHEVVQTKMKDNAYIEQFNEQLVEKNFIEGNNRR